MEQCTRFFTSGGFFNNIGSNVREGMLDEIAEWMIATKCEYYDSGFNCNGFNTIEGVKSVLVVGDDKKLHYKYSSYYSYLKIYINKKTPSIPSSLVIGKDICVELIFNKVSQKRMDEWKNRLSDVYIARLSLNNCKINNWDWINDIRASIGELTIVSTSMPNGFNGFKPKVNYFVRVRKCDIENLDNFPEMNSDTEVDIMSCHRLLDISGLADRNRYFKALNIEDCSNVSCTKNLNLIHIKTLYIHDVVIKRIIQNGDLFGSVTKYISILSRTRRDYDEADKIAGELNKRYPWADIIATKK